jgi:NAD(P)H-dependent FMN reductase
MNKLFIPILLGTAREGRESEKVAKYVFSEVSELGLFDTQLVDVKNHLFGKTAIYPEVANPWKEIMAKADGLIIVSPEYNRGMPGELKILLDSLEDEYVKKPVVVVGASSGKVGGGRMAEHILPTLITLGMVPIYPAILFPVVQGLFAADGSIADDSYKKRIVGTMNRLVEMAETLKTIRK